MTKYCHNIAKTITPYFSIESLNFVLCHDNSYNELLSFEH